MGLPPAAPSRQLKHRRQIDVQVFARDDGLWEVDARLTDTKTREWQLARGRLPAGHALHDMLLRLVVDEHFVIREAGAQSDATPYPGYCDQYGDAYARLVGLNLMRGFRHALHARLGGVLGCTHITEMAQLLPTAVIQAFAGEVIDVADGISAISRPAPEPHAPAAARAASPAAQRSKVDADESVPFQLDACHALRRDAPAVAAYYPRWYLKPESAAPMPPAV